jgi:Tfp pilus assembly protein PilF
MRADSAAAWRLRAVLLAGDADGARAALHKAIEAAPGQLAVPEQVALIAPEFQRAANRLDATAAGKLQQKLLQIASESPLTQWVTGELQLIRGAAGEATGTFQLLVQRRPDFSAARPALIAALLVAGSLEQAVQESAVLVGNSPDDQRPKAVQKAIKQAADAPKGSERQILQSATAALMLEQVPAARWLLEHGVAAHPDSEPLALLAIQRQQAAGDASKALDRARELVTRTPKSPAAQALLAALEASSGDLRVSQRIYEGLWQQAPSLSVALALAQLRLRTHDSEPLEPVQQWLTGHPDDLLARTFLASTAMGQGQFEVATREYERVVAAAPANALALNNLAWLYSQKGDKRALPFAQRAHEAADTPQIADTYGWLLAQAGDVKSALPLLEKAARAALDNPEIRFHYAAVLARSTAAQDRAKARLWLADLLSVPSNAQWHGDAEKLLAQLQAL